MDKKETTIPLFKSNKRRPEYRLKSGSEKTDQYPDKHQSSEAPSPS
jgi:hypothetical protein